MNNILRKVHDKITFAMSKSTIVEKMLIASYTEIDDEGNVQTYDCIYCTILRNLVLGMLIGGTLVFLISLYF